MMSFIKSCHFDWYKMSREKKALSDLKQLKLYVPKLMHRLHFRFDWHHSHCEPIFTQCYIPDCWNVICWNLQKWSTLQKNYFLWLLFTFKLSDFNVILQHFVEKRKKISSFSVVIGDKVVTAWVMHTIKCMLTSRSVIKCLLSLNTNPA